MRLSNTRSIFTIKVRNDFPRRSYERGNPKNYAYVNMIHLLEHEEFLPVSNSGQMSESLG